MEVVVQGVEGLQELEFTLYLSFHTLQGVFRDVFHTNTICLNFSQG